MAASVTASTLADIYAVAGWIVVAYLVKYVFQESCPPPSFPRFPSFPPVSLVFPRFPSFPLVSLVSPIFPRFPSFPSFPAVVRSLSNEAYNCLIVQTIYVGLVGPLSKIPGPKLAAISWLPSRLRLVPGTR